MARKNAERDEKGKFIQAPKTPDEFEIGFDTWSNLINAKLALKQTHLMYMKYLRGTIKLDNMQAKALVDIYKILTDKVAPNARGGDTGPTEVDVVIKPPEAPK